MMRPGTTIAFCGRHMMYIESEQFRGITCRLFCWISQNDMRYAYYTDLEVGGSPVVTTPPRGYAVYLWYQQELRRRCITSELSV